MIKKILSALVLLFFVFNLAGSSLAAKKAKKSKAKTKITRQVAKKKAKAKKVKKTKKVKKIKKVKKTKPSKKKAAAKAAKPLVPPVKPGRPVFPVSKTPEDTSFLVPPPAPEYEEIIPATPEAAPKLVGRSNFALEGGFGGGGIILGLGYQRKISNKLNFAAGVGYGIGSQYGVVILDVARVHSEMGGYVIGGGLNYAMYSSIVGGILGLSGNIPSKNLLGLELFWGKPFRFQGHDALGMIGYNTALGLRLTASFEF